MKKLIAISFLIVGFSASLMAADLTGYIVDEKCSGNKAMWSNEACAEKCIKGGSAAVFVSEDGKVYKIDNQDQVTAHAGHKVTISGTVTGDTIKVDNVKM